MTSKEVYEGGDQTELWNYKYASIGNLERVDKFVVDENGALMPAFRIEYLIDGMNRRVGRIKKSEYNAETYEFEITDKKGWLYDGGLNPIAELDGEGNVVARFVYGTRANVPDYVERKVGLDQFKTYRLATNHLGSPVALIDVAEGEGAQEISYDEFGQATIVSGNWVIPFGFAGGIFDWETGLVRFGARDYDPETGRWTTKDPIGFRGGDSNLYGYVMNEPVNWFDSHGLEMQISITAVASLMPGVVGVSAGAGVGISLDWNPLNWQVFALSEGTLMGGFGIWAGLGLDGSIGYTDGPVKSGESTHVHAENNIGWGKSGGIGFEAELCEDDEGYFTGNFATSVPVKLRSLRFGGGFGFMAGAGVTKRYTAASGTLGDFFDWLFD